MLKFCFLMLVFFFSTTFCCTLLETTCWTVACAVSTGLNVKCEFKGGKTSCDCGNGAKLDISDHLICNKLGL
ncbi:hypothetical protein BJ944DRAFT_270837 [Cunninghamella echinulata]|nr:hypothetical protein BJ944DRAFT_270837 [Cunninghamella echinulata]